MPPIIENLSKHNFAECSKVLAAGSKYPKHTHEEYVISANLSGHERIWFDGKSQDIGPNQVTIYNPLTIQASEFSPTESQFISIHLDAKYVQSTLSECNSSNGLPIFKEGGASDVALHGSILGVYECSFANQREETLLALLGELSKLQAEPILAAEPIRIQQLVEYMKENLYEEISLDNLCAEANLSKYHLVRSFKDIKHLPPMQYFNQLRLIEARNRLRRGDHPSTVATDLYFFDQGHLSNAFRKVMGVSPRKYTSMLEGC